MAIKVGNSWVSEAAYAHAKSKTEKSKSDSNMLKNLSEKFPDTKFTTNTSPFKGTGKNNIAVSSNILQQMENDPEKQLEYEALIYDCNSIAKSLSKQSFQGGKKLVSQGFIINSDGSLSSWSVSKSDEKDTKSLYSLPKNNKKSWINKILNSSNLSKINNKQDWLI